MYDPSKYGAEFGSELRRRQTPDLARRKRRSVFFGTIIILTAGVLTLVEAVDAIRTGRMITVGRRGSTPMTGYEAGAIALFTIACCVLSLWKSRRPEE